MRITNTQIAILAAGKGTRLKSDVPKAIVKLNNKPLISFLIDSINSIQSCGEILVVVSPNNKDSIRKELSSYKNINYCIQEKQLGTADAVQSILKSTLMNSENLLILLADHPLIHTNTIRDLIDTHLHTNSLLTMLTAEVPNYDGIYKYFFNDGRIVRGSDNNIEAIKEPNELSVEQMEELKEINPSIYVFNTKWLRENIKKIEINQQKQEYYLTHIINIAFQQKIKVNSFTIDALEAFGINTMEQLEEANNLILENCIMNDNLNRYEQEHHNLPVDGLQGEQDMTAKQALKKVLFGIARSPVSAYFIGFAFENLSNIIPLNRLVSNDRVVAFEHPSHFWEEHFLVVPKKSIRRFLDIRFDESAQANAILEVFSTGQQLVKSNSVLEQKGNFSLLVNGGAYQDVPQIHFHLAAGKAREGIGFIPSDYRPQEGKILIQNPSCTIAQNANPEREIDYIVVPNIAAVNSYGAVDFSANSSVILKTLATVQGFLLQLELSAFTILTTESDIQNSGRFNLRIVSGKRIS